MEEATGFRVSPQQEDLWANEPDGPTGSIQAVLSLEGPLEPSVLEAALEHVIGRHEILRTTFARRPGIRVPFQVIHDSLPASWEILDLDGAGEDDRRARIDAALTQARSLPWDYEHGPLVRATLADSGDGRQILSLTLPALSADAASVPALVSDLIAYAFDRELADEPLQYADFSEWQHERRSVGDETAQAAQGPLAGGSRRCCTAGPARPRPGIAARARRGRGSRRRSAHGVARRGCDALRHDLRRGDSRGLACIPRARHGSGRRRRLDAQRDAATSRPRGCDRARRASAAHPDQGAGRAHLCRAPRSAGR